MGRRGGGRKKGDERKEKWDEGSKTDSDERRGKIIKRKREEG